MGLVAMQTFGDQHAGAQPVKQARGQLHRTAMIADHNGRAIRNAQAGSVVGVNEDARLALTPEAEVLFKAVSAGPADTGMHTLSTPKDAAAFVKACRALRYWDRIA